MFKKYFAVLLMMFFAFPSLSHAAPSDCRQTHADGTYDCFEALDKAWKIDDPQAPVTRNFDELRARAVSDLCSGYLTFTCYEQSGPNNPPLPADKACSGDCNNYTHEYSEEFRKSIRNNSGGIVVVTYFKPDKNIYSQNTALVYTYQQCPANSTAVYPGFNRLVLCKPPMPTVFSCNSDKSLCPEIVSPTDEQIKSVTPNKNIVVKDYTYNSQYPVVFNRYYGSSHGVWRHEYERHLSYLKTSQGDFIRLSRPDFQDVMYKKTAGVWNQYGTAYAGTLIQLGKDFSYKNEKNEVEYYTNAKLSESNVFSLTSVTLPEGASFSLQYDTSGLLTKIKDPYLNEFVVTTSTSLEGCNNQEKIISFTAFANTPLTYTYDTGCRLVKVTYPDGTIKTHSYQGYYLVHTMTGIGIYFDTKSFHALSK